MKRPLPPLLPVGLSGVDLGNFLIKHVVQELQHEFPNIAQYSTLSPVPGFKQWLRLQINQALEQQGTTSNLTLVFIDSVEMHTLKICTLKFILPDEILLCGPVFE